MPARGRVVAACNGGAKTTHGLARTTTTTSLGNGIGTVSTPDWAMQVYTAALDSGATTIQQQDSLV